MCRTWASKIACEKPSTPRLQRAALSRTHLPQVPSTVPQVLASPGQLLEAEVRASMESRFGHDFSRVRVHTDGRAAESARAVGALAYTVGRDIVFAAGQYAPGSAAGRRLVAHELAHVVQQGGAAFRSGSTLQVAPAAGALEDQAHTAARSSEGPVPVAAAASAVHTLQRASEEVGVHGGGGIKKDDNPCAGWYSDRESTTKRAAELYVRTELHGDRGVVERIECDLSGSDGRFACVAHFSDGTPIRVFVRPDVIIVSVYPVQSLTPPPDRPLCWYDYACPGPDQDLVLTKRKCDSAKPAGTAPSDGGRRGPNP